MTQTFWNHDHPRYAEAAAAQEQLVPSSGPAGTVEGELLRAVAQITHDFYNNGFGNNWSGALAYLDAYLGVPAPIRRELRKFARGRCFPDRRSSMSGSDGMDEKLSTLTCLVLDRVALGGRTPNPIDMLSLQEPDAR